MKKLALLLLTALFITGCSPASSALPDTGAVPSAVPVSVSAEVQNGNAGRVERINTYYNQGMYYEALDELNWLDASGDRSTWDQAQIDSMRATLTAAAANVTPIYQKFGLIKSYLNQGKYYEARDELNWLKAGYPLPPTESQRWGEYNLDATLGIEKYEQAVVEAQAEAARQAAEAARRSQQAAQSSASQNTSYTVYITRTGEKYHRSGCRYLRQSKIAIDRSAAIRQGYTPCSVCNP